MEGSFHDTDTQPYTAEDFRFTKKRDLLYAIELACLSSREAVIHSLGRTALGAESKIESVSLVGSDSKLEFEQRDDGLHIQLPEHTLGKYAYSFQVRLD